MTYRYAPGCALVVPQSTSLGATPFLRLGVNDDLYDAGRIRSAGASAGYSVRILFSDDTTPPSAGALA